MPSPFSVDVFADPGLPSRLVSRLLAEASAEEDARYEFSHNRRQIPLRDDGTLDLATVKEWSRRNSSDLTVIVTETPRRAGRRPKMVALHLEDRLAIVSLPALGWFGLPARLREAVLGSLDALTDDDVAGGREPHIECGVVHAQTSETGRSYYVASPWWRPGRIRLVLGMVRTNEPLTTVPKLSGALAAASATGAFGIFYDSIWSMANALPTWRLSLITVMSVLTMVCWLIFGNGLWERSRRMGSLAEATIYNASTVVTLALTVALLYLALFVGILTGASVVIDAAFMSETIGSGVTPANYVDIAWLSASMGTVAGALGSNFDSNVDIRNLTHGYRQTMRYRARDER